MEADLRYPIGKFQKPESLAGDERREFIAQIAARARSLDGIDVAQNVGNGYVGSR